MKKIVFLFLMLFNVTSILTDGKIGLGIHHCEDKQHKIC